MCIWFMFYLCREKNKTLFWANKALFYRLRKRNANRNIKKTASSHNFWICREYAFCLRIWSRLCMRMRRPVQDGLYCESLWNPAKLSFTGLPCAGFQVSRVAQRVLGRRWWRWEPWQNHFSSLLMFHSKTAKMTAVSQEFCATRPPWRLSAGHCSSN